MQKIIQRVGGKIGFIAAIGLAAVVGGATTGVVMAAIPDASGNLNTCYRNNGGDLRVIDTATQSCANNETAFNMSQTVNSTNTAYFRVKNGSVDTSALRNIIDYEYEAGYGWCIQSAFAPDFGVGKIGMSQYTDVWIGNLSADATYEIHDGGRCASNANFNVFMVASSDTQDAALWLTK